MSKLSLPPPPLSLSLYLETKLFLGRGIVPWNRINNNSDDDKDDNKANAAKC